MSEEEEAAEEEGAERSPGGIQAKKQEPHTVMWGKKI